MRRTALIDVRRSLPEGHFTRLLMGVGAVLWGIRSLQIGQDELLSPDLYTTLLDLLTLNQWAALGILIGLATLAAAVTFHRKCDFICALLMSLFWTGWGYFINKADDNALTPVFCLVMAVGNAMTLWIILVRHPCYER